MVGGIRMRQRLQALEALSFDGFVPFVQVIQKVGQTEAEAVATYEAEHGPVADDVRILLVVIHQPGMIGE